MLKNQDDLDVLKLYEPAFKSRGRKGSTLDSSDAEALIASCNLAPR